MYHCMVYECLFVLLWCCREWHEGVTISTIRCWFVGGVCSLVLESPCLVKSRSLETMGRPWQLTFINVSWRATVAALCCFYCGRCPRFMILCAHHVRLSSVALHRLWIIDLHIVCKIMQESCGSKWTASTLDIMCDPKKRSNNLSDPILLLK